MMMESNCEKKTSNMKTQATQQRKEIFHDSFFVRRPIISSPNGQLGLPADERGNSADSSDKQNIFHIENDTKQPSFSFSYTQSQHNMKTTATPSSNFNDQPVTGELPISTCLPVGTV